MKNVQIIIQFMNLNRCQFANFSILFEVYYKKTPNFDDGDNNDNRGVVNGVMDAITDIILPLFLSAQLYDQDMLAVKIDFEETGVHQIDAMTVKFPAKFSCGTAER
jgi:hypothetical protein